MMLSRSATPKEMPQEAKMPKEWKNDASTIGKRSFNKPKTSPLAKTKPARRLATKVSLTSNHRVEAIVKTIKAAS